LVLLLLVAVGYFVAEGLKMSYSAIQGPIAESGGDADEHAGQPRNVPVEFSERFGPPERIVVDDGADSANALYASGIRDWELSLSFVGASYPVAAYLLEHGRDYPKMREVARIARFAPPLDAGNKWLESARVSVNFDPDANPPDGNRQYFIGLIPESARHVGACVRIGSAASMLDASAISLPDVSFAEGRPLEIRLVGPGGDPVEGVEVVPLCDANWLMGSGIWRIRGKSNNVGVIRFPEPLRNVVLMSDTPGWRIGASDERIVVVDGVRDVRIEPNQTISGIVVDSTGIPMSGVLVDAVGMRGYTLSESLQSVSDDRGRFSIPNSLPDGVAVELFCALNRRGDTRDRVPSISEVPVAVQGLVVQMGDLSKVSLRVVRDENGEPVKNYAVDLHGEAGAALGALSGYHHGGVLVLRVRVDQVTHAKVIPVSKDMKPSSKVKLTPGQGVIEVRLGKALPLEIVVMDYADRPIKGVEMTLREARVDTDPYGAGIRPVTNFIDSDRASTDDSGRVVLWHAQGARQVQLLSVIGSETVAKRMVQTNIGQQIVRLDTIGLASARIAQLHGMSGARYCVEYRRLGGSSAQHRIVQVGLDGVVDSCALPAGSYEAWLLAGEEGGSVAARPAIGLLATVDVESGKDHFWDWLPPGRACRVELSLMGVAGPGVNAPDAVVVLTSVDAEGRRGSSFSAPVDRVSNRANLELIPGKYCVEYFELVDRTNWRVFLSGEICSIDAAGSFPVQLHSAAVEIEDVNGPVEGVGVIRLIDRTSPFDGAYPFRNESGVLRSDMLAPGRYQVQLQDGRQAIVEIPWSNTVPSRGVDGLRIRADFRRL
jgi:hypothetical protein